MQSPLADSVMRAYAGILNLFTHHKFVISTEGEAEVEKPAFQRSPLSEFKAHTQMQVSPLRDDGTVAPVEMTDLWWVRRKPSKVFLIPIRNSLL